MLRLAAIVILSALALGGLPTHANAQSWPQRPVKFVIPLGPGAGVDITARLIGDRRGRTRRCRTTRASWCRSCA
jgi:tripartite-type tricarboxylate transporter receptor subunit TctC